MDLPDELVHQRDAERDDHTDRPGDDRLAEFAVADIGAREDPGARPQTREAPPPLDAWSCAALFFLCDGHRIAS